ncbi:MAG: 4Fe-4S dicluster domain-containing protein [Candidatus Cloacimonetes bacterium]|nr:4Fe-4S dicluster domain-containing protein [Candidatus Cloacimonadota bacterium]
MKDEKHVNVFEFSRRQVLGFLSFMIGGLYLKFVHASNFIFKHQTPKFSFLRPPGTESEDEFLSKCIRCRACANVCESGCIEFFSMNEGLLYAGTPYLDVRKKSCNLCMNCTQVCPTDALKTILRNKDAIKKEVKMGDARVIRSHCLSENGRVCGVCHDACPLKGEAIKLKPIAKPIIDNEVCIGCGRCEERCPQFPSAIIVERKETQHV